MKTTDLLTVEEVAERLKCHPQTVRRWIWSGKLGSVKAGGLVRVPEEEIRLLLEAGGSSTDEQRRRVGLAALRSTMQALRGEVTEQDMEDLARKILEGEQSADWGQPIE